MSVLVNTRQKRESLSLHPLHKWGAEFAKDWFHLCYTAPQGRYGYVRHVLDAARCAGSIWLFEDMKHLHSYRAGKRASALHHGKARTLSWPQGSRAFQDQPGQGLP